MKILKKILIITAVFVIAPSFITAQSFIETENIYISQLDSFLNNSVVPRTIAENLDELSSITSEASDFKNLYLHSKILLLKGILLAEEGNSKDSVTTLEKAQAAAEKALKLTDEADCYRILGEAGSAIMLQKGVPYIITHGGKVEEYINRAIELDPLNIRAQVLKAQSLLNKPFIFGGSVKNGVKLLSELKNLDSGTKADRFFILYNLSIGYQKQKKEDEAAAAADLAQKLYPQNAQLIRLLKELPDSTN